MATRVWIDTDIGTDVDDALALAFALRHSELELAGVSTVFGDVELRARMVEALLLLAGAEGVPVLVGLGKPLTEHRIGLMFGHEGQGLLEDASPRLRTESDPRPERQVDALAEAIVSARADALVAIGPLTNVAALLRAGVKLPRLSIMGGKTTPGKIEGMTGAIDEWNWRCDPEAAKTLLTQEPPGPTPWSPSSWISPDVMLRRSPGRIANAAGAGSGDAVDWEAGPSGPVARLHSPKAMTPTAPADRLVMTRGRRFRDRRPGPRSGAWSCWDSPARTVSVPG